MAVALVTGAGGLVGAASVRRFAKEGFTVVGIDNYMRGYFFGEKASTEWACNRHSDTIPGYIHQNVDIRDAAAVDRIFGEYGKDIEVIIHCAAQPSHDWAAKEPITDFSVNANGTLVLLEATKKFCPEAVFVFTSTNKVYGDTPNFLPLVELEDRWEIEESHPYYKFGIDEQMSIDHSTHSLFGVSKVAADLLVQEYARYFGIKTSVFRGGCLTGPGHSGAELHGFLAYLMSCTLSGSHYTVYGYKGKQVRDNIHCDDLVNCFYHFYKNPRPGEVYNIGGGRFSNCSMREAITVCEEIAGKKLSHSYSETNRIGDHMWWISDISKFQAHYPRWNLTYDIKAILTEIYEELLERPAAGRKKAAAAA